jgi:hypothetical protein
MGYDTAMLTSLPGTTITLRMVLSAVHFRTAASVRAACSMVVLSVSAGRFLNFQCITAIRHDIVHGIQLLRVLIGNCPPELLFNREDNLQRIKVIRAYVTLETGIITNFIYLLVELICNDAFDGLQQVHTTSMFGVD